MNKKLRRLAPLGALLCVASLIMAVAVFYFVRFDKSRTGNPTLELDPTPGDPVVEVATPSAVSARPLQTQAQALDAALNYDRTVAVWDQPWNKQTLAADVGRITIRLFPSRTAESADAGRNEEFTVQADGELGAVWRIAIKGDVTVHVISPPQGANATKYNGVTYIFQQRTGDLLAIITGQLK